MARKKRESRDAGASDLWNREEGMRNGERQRALREQGVRNSYRKRKRELTEIFSTEIENREPTEFG